MHWHIRLPYAAALDIALPIVFALLAVAVLALPPRVQPEMVLAPAALTFWVVWFLWAYPSVSYRNGEYLIRNPFRAFSFSGSSRIRVTGQHAPTFHLGKQKIRPIAMLSGSASIVATAHASTGVDRGVNVVPMEHLRPGHEDGVEAAGSANALQAECDRAGDRAPLLRRSWNTSGATLTIALATWAITALV